MSLSGPRFRVLQAHYQYPHIVIRKSETVDLRSDLIERMSIMFRWMMSHPRDNSEVKKAGTRRRKENPVKSPPHAAEKARLGATNPLR